MFSAERYLARIGLDAQIGPPSVDLLAALQLAHLIRVPFENLHAFHHRGVRTDVEWSYAKVVEQQRGGWCFELNGAFGALLRRLGFAVDYASCRVWEADLADWGPRHDHLGLIVHADGARWFVDVGFGDCCIHPLLVESGERVAVPRAARLDLGGAAFTLTELMSAGSAGSAPAPSEWEPQLHVALQPVSMPVFERRNTFLQTQPGLSWTEKAFATRALDATGSRVTLRMDVLRSRDGTGAWTESAVSSSEEWSSLLMQHFGIDDGNVR